MPFVNETQITGQVPGSSSRAQVRAKVSTEGHLLTDANITDKDGKKATVSEAGSLNVQIKENYESEDTLSEILTQLKIMNLHLSMMTDTHIRKTEVE